MLTAVLLVVIGTALLDAAANAADWPTYHRNNSRLGADPQGPPLGHARRLWSAALDGAVYAEPIVARGEVVVATENDSLYAFDAASGTLRWRRHLGTPVSGGSLPCGDIDPSGITGTPVADPGSGLVYAVVFLRGFKHQLVAVNLGSGHVRFRRRVDPPGADPRVHQQRSALALSHGRVYVAYGGLNGDCGNYHGWVVGAPAAGRRGRLVSFRVPTHREGGIWAPSGPAVDGAGNVYVATGNGDSSSFDYGNAVIRLTKNLRRTSFFAPANAGALNSNDTDLGSVGPLLLPNGRVFAIGKSGIGYILGGRKLGGSGHALGAQRICGAAFGGLAYADGTVYVACTSGTVAVRVSGTSMNAAWSGPGHNSAPIVAGAGVWIVSDGNLLQLDPGSGRVRFSAALGSTATFATASASDGRIYAAGGGRIYAFG